MLCAVAIWGSADGEIGMLVAAEGAEFAMREVAASGDQRPILVSCRLAPVTVWHWAQVFFQRSSSATAVCSEIHCDGVKVCIAGLAGLPPSMREGSCISRSSAGCAAM